MLYQHILLPARPGPCSSSAGIQGPPCRTILLRPPPSSCESYCMRANSHVSASSNSSRAPLPPSQAQHDNTIQHWGVPWDYKYTRVSCSSPCSPEDMHCLKVCLAAKQSLGLQSEYIAYVRTHAGTPAVVRAHACYPFYEVKIEVCMCQIQSKHLSAFSQHTVSSLVTLSSSLSTEANFEQA